MSAQGLIDRGLSPERPVAILSGNGLEHALMGLGSMYAGVPYASISPAYSLIARDLGKLRGIIELLTPGLVFATNGAQFARAIEAAVPPDTELVVLDNAPNTRASTSLEALWRTTPGPAVEEAHARVTPDTIAKLLFSGSAARFPDIKWIFSHAGGTMPFLIERFIFEAKSPRAAKALPNGLMHEVKKFYFDVAQAFQAPPMLGLKKLVPVSQIVFGTDYPFRTTEEHVKGLRECGVFTAAELQAIERDNALRLLPPRYRV